MKNLLFRKLLGLLGRKLDGYKTLIAGVGWALLGVVIIINAMFPDAGLNVDGIEEAMASFNTAMTAWGLGGKAEKLKATIEAQAPVAVELVSVKDSRDVTDAPGE